MFILTFATSLMLMVYVHTSARPRLRSESRIPDDSIPLVDFKDLGSRKPRVLLLVTAGSAPQRSNACLLQMVSFRMPLNVFA